MIAAHPLELVGHARPRLAPPVPARSDVAELEAEAVSLGMPLIPWQSTAGRYVYALGFDDRWLYPEVAVVVSRQNGKTKLLKPHVMRRLRMGRRILHLAQTRELPRRLHLELVPIVMREFPDAIIRRGAGQETIELPPSEERPNGALYVIAAATSGGARGLSSIDDLLVDEVRELDEYTMAAATPTTIASLNPQTLYLSNAGHESTEVLNAIRKRGEEGDPALAYLEWSASPERDPGDRAGWAEANPSLGHRAFPTLEGTLERIYTSSRMAGNMAHFETEYLCRWVKTMRETLVDLELWQKCEGVLSAPTKVFMGISLDPEGQRASAAIAWQQSDNTMELRSLVEATGSPINVDKLGRDLREMARTNHVTTVGFDPLTDSVLAKYFPRTEAIAGQKYANASARFVTLVESGKMRWADCAAVGNDLTWTARKEHDESGSFQAVRANDERPITAALAAIRAVMLASTPPFERKPRVGVGHG